MAGKFDRKICCDFAAEIKNIKKSGPARVYLLYGPEDYLREYFLGELKKFCLPNGDDGFSYKRFDGPGIDETLLEDAVNQFPFLSERTIIELRDVDINKIASEKMTELLKNIPDYCTLAFVQEADFSPDGRLKFIKTLKAAGKDMYFAEQPQNKLNDWICKRFRYYGKEIDTDAVQRLVFVSGSLMNRLIPEIEKVAAYAADPSVHVSDVDAVAYRIPEAQAFDIIDQISVKNFDAAVKILAEMLKGRDGNAIVFLSSLGYQLRHMYGARLALAMKKSKAETVEILGIRDFSYDKLIGAARRFSIDSLQKAILDCAEAEYRLKTSQADDEEVLKDILVGLITSE